jgi:hypothetical protein
MIADVAMFADPERKEPRKQLNLPMVSNETAETAERSVVARAPEIGPAPSKQVEPAQKKRFVPRNFVKEARAELKALDREIKRLEELKIHRAEVARMLAAATEIAAEKKTAKPLRAIAS